MESSDKPLGRVAHFIDRYTVYLVPVVLVLIVFSLLIFAEKPEPRQPVFTIHEAASRGDIATVLAYLGSGVDPATPDKHGMNALQIAAADGQTELVRALLDFGMKVDSSSDMELCNEDGWMLACMTPLSRAASKGNYSLSRFLLDKGAGPTASLVFAAGGGNTDLMDLLLERGGKPEILSFGSMHMAAGAGDEKMVDYLVSKGVSTTEAYGVFGTPLHMAAGAGSLPLMHRFIRDGSPVEVRDYLGHTPLARAAIQGRLEAVKIGVSGFRC